MVVTFANDLVLTSKTEVGRQQQLDLLQQFCAKCGLTMNVENKEVMVFNSVDPCQEFVFKGDVIGHV
jgi:hypothetical protein